MHIWRSAHSWLRGWSDAKSGTCNVNQTYNPDAYRDGWNAAHNAAGVEPKPCQA